MVKNQRNQHVQLKMGIPSFATCVIMYASRNVGVKCQLVSILCWLTRVLVALCPLSTDDEWQQKSRQNTLRLKEGPFRFILNCNRIPFLSPHRNNGHHRNSTGNQSMLPLAWEHRGLSRGWWHLFLGQDFSVSWLIIQHIRSLNCGSCSDIAKIEILLLCRIW